MSKQVVWIQVPTDASADYPHKGFRESKMVWEEFSRYVTEMVGETALRWEVISHSDPEESLEGWKKNIEELRRCISLFYSLRWNDTDIQS